MKPKCLIVCYSYTGNTHRIATALARLAGGDLVDIWPRQPYPMTFEPLLEQARREVASHYYPTLLPIPVDPMDYNMVFVGTPNWCSTIAPPLASFLVKYKLTGKTVAPFYSHCGGASGNLQRDIQRLCHAAQVGPVLSVTGDGGGKRDQILHTWLKKLGLARVLISKFSNTLTFCCSKRLPFTQTYSVRLLAV